MTTQMSFAARNLSTRFQGAAGRQLISQVISSLPLIAGDAGTAQEIGEAATIEAYEIGDVIITQGAVDSDILFILAGSVTIAPNGRYDTVRRAPAHIGEMAAIDPTVRRSATAKAAEPTVIARVSESDMSRIANAHPFLWRHFAVELAERLRQRVANVPARKEIARVFLASSSEGLLTATALKAALAADPYEVKIWTDEIFTPGLTNIEALEEELTRADFAVLLLSPDDRVLSRWMLSHAPRDNLILEIGLFMGALSRRRAIMALPRRSKLKIPTDLLGVTPIRYPATDMEFVATELRIIFSSLGAK